MYQQLVCAQGPYSIGDIISWHHQGHLPAHMALFQLGSEGQPQPLQELLAVHAAHAHASPPQVRLNVMLARLRGILKSGQHCRTPCLQMSCSCTASRSLPYLAVPTLHVAVIAFRCCLLTCMQASPQIVQALSSPPSMQQSPQQPGQPTASLAALSPALAQQWSQSRPATPDMPPPLPPPASSLSPEQKAAQLLQAFGYGPSAADDRQQAAAQVCSTSMPC